MVAPLRAVAIRLMVSNASTETVVDPLGLVVVLETIVHRGCPLSGGCRMDRGLPIEMRGSRLVTCGGLLDERGRDLGLLDSGAF
jgi:hypothetical protein